MVRRTILAVRNRLYVFLLRVRSIRLRLLSACGAVRTGPGLLLGRGVDLRLYGEFRVGANVYLDRNCSIQVAPGATLVLGDSVYVGQSTVIAAAQHIEVGEHVLVAEHCSVRDSDHQIDPKERRNEAFATCAPVSIAADVWIGAGVRVLRGARIGRGAVVAANSVVRGDVRAMTLVAGAPARVIRTLASSDDRADAAAASVEP